MAKTLEEIAKQLKKMKFKSALVGGVDKKDVWKKIERLNDDYMQYIEQQRIGYEAVLAEKDHMIAGGITVNAAQILPGPGAMPPMDPNMMPPQMQQPSPWGEGAPIGADEGSYAGMPPMPPAMMGLPPMLDENGNPMPMPPMDPAMMGGMPPFDPAMMGMAMPMPGADYAPPQGFDPNMMPMPGADYAPPAGGFEPDWGTPAPAQNTVRPLQGELGPQGPEGAYAPPADLPYAHPVDMHPHGDPAMPPTNPAMMGLPPMTPPGPQMPPFNPGPVPGGMPVSPEGVG